MKLSEMTTEQAFDVMVRIEPHLAAILGDEEVVKRKRAMKDGEHTGADMLRGLFPLMLQKHGDDLIEIVAALSGKTTAQVRTQSIADTREVISDNFIQEMFDFFTLSLRMVAHA